MDFYQLKNIIESLDTTSFKYKTSGSDGRIDSAVNESRFIEWLNENLGHIFKEAPAARYWYDCLYDDEDNYFPINIKITSGKGADNSSSKEGMFYALTGIKPDNSISKWTPFIRSLQENLRENNCDYYYIVYYKDSGKILFTSLKRINKLVPNGNNLPFQINWGKISHTNRTEKESIKYIYSIFRESWDKKVGAYKEFLNFNIEEW